MTCFFSRAVKKMFSWNCGPWWFIKGISRNTKLLPVAPDDILRSYEAKRSVCARNWTLFTALWPVIQSLRQMVRVTNESFYFCEQVESVHQIWLKLLNQLTTRAAQIHKLLNQISLSDAWQSLRLEMRHSSGVSDPVMMNGSSNSPWTEETARLEPKTDEPLIFSSVNRTLEWRDRMNVFMASHRLCKKTSGWSSLYML